MTARIGADDLVLFQNDDRRLLRAVSGSEPEPQGWYVQLPGVASMDRLALGRVGASIVVGLWPAELQAQARSLYGQGSATPMIRRALDLAWTAEPSPQLAFWNSHPRQRLYLRPTIDVLAYAANWETGDLSRVRRYSRDDVEQTVWPWLKQRGYAVDRDDAVLAEFLDVQLGKRPADLRSGLRLKRRWDGDAVREAGDGIYTLIRSEVNAILAAAGEPVLPARH